MKFSQHGIKFNTQETDRKDGRILVASGTQSRNRDWGTGKPYRLVPSGMRYDVWAKTGLVLYMHNFNIPLGRGRMFLEEGQLWAPDAIDFHRGIVPIATQNWIGDAIGEFNTAHIADLWDQKYLNSVSIHVMFTMEDENNIVELEDEILIPTSEVIEFSVVTVPGDREANRERLLTMGMHPDLVECLVCNVDDKGSQNTTKSGLILPNGVANVVDAGTGADNAQVAPNPLVEVHSMETEEQEAEGTEETVETEESAAEETPTEVVAETVELEPAAEEEFQVDVLEVAQAIAGDPEALMVLAQAFASDPDVLSTFAEAFRQNASHILSPQSTELIAPARTQPRIRFVSNGAKPQPPGPQGASPAEKEAAKRRQLAQQAPKNPAQSNIPPKRKRALLGLVHNT